MRRKRIDEHTLGVLEFGQVLEMLGGYASSGLGREVAGSLYPSVDVDWIQRRVAETTELKGLLERDIRVPLAGLRDIRVLLSEFGKKETVFEPEELFDISDTLTACGRLRKFFGELDAGEFPHLIAVAGKLRDYEKTVGEIDRCIDGDKKVRDSASEKLVGIRKQISKLSREIRRRFRAIVSSPKLRNAVENDKFLMRHGRPVVALKTDYRSRLHGTVLDRSNTGATLYVEPDELVELSNEFEDVLFEEKKEIGHILFELTRLILDQRESILSSLDTLGLIDLTFAKAKFSLAYDMTAAEIHEGTELVLRQARHPLLLRLVSEQKECEIVEAMGEVVPIDLRLGDDFDLLLVTGPTLMAQSGMHVSVREGSKVPVFRQVYADIGDEQSIQQSLSTFSAHMRQIVNILERTNKKTLVLLDELGAGTDPTEGAALATAILDGLLKKHGRVIATSHLGQLKTYAYTTARAENASVRFDIKTLQPTYQLMIGTPGSSNALAIASRLGMPGGVVEHANGLLAGEADNASDLINQVQSIREDAEQKRKKAADTLDDAKGIRTKAKEQLRDVRAEGDRLKQQADRAIEESMQKVRRVTGDFAQKMQNAPKSWKQLADDLQEAIDAAADSTPLAVRHAKFMEIVRKGDTVHVISFRRNGIVEKIHRKRRTVAVLVEGKQVRVPFADVSPALGKA